MTWLRRYWAGQFGSRNPVLLARAARYDQEREAALARLTGRPAADVRAAVAEIEADRGFLQVIRQGLAAGSDYRPRPADFRLFGRWGSVFFFPVALYALVRLARPEVVVETGGTPGKSSAFILRGRPRNGRGRLITIDLPPAPLAGPGALSAVKMHQHLPAGRGSGWIVPAELKGRQSLRLGRSAELLISALEETGGADLFLHDSDHSYANMLWEFEAAWPRLRPGGVLFADDVISNAAFDDFCRQHGLAGRRLVNVGMARRP